MFAESFAIIVGLMGQFRSERGDKQQADFNDFLQWLIESNHLQMKEQLDLNTQTTIYIKALLNQDHKIFKEKLGKIDSAIAAFASTIDGFAELATSLNPNAVLSEQAMSLLKQFEKSGSSKVLQIPMRQFNIYQFIETGGKFEISNERFIEDDLKTLVELGLLRHERNSSGNNVYMYTRAASKLVSDTNS